jgi:hypothetical protein
VVTFTAAANQLRHGKFMRHGRTNTVKVQSVWRYGQGEKQEYFKAVTKTG